MELIVKEKKKIKKTCSFGIDISKMSRLDFYKLGKF